MKILEDEYDGSFRFEGWEGQLDSSECHFCNSKMINHAYMQILQSLKEAGLLPQDFPPICCCCWKSFGIFGEVYCPRCGSLLQMDWYQDDEVTFICHDCDFYEEYRVPNPDVMKENYEYNPALELMEWYCDED